MTDTSATGHVPSHTPPEDSVALAGGPVPGSTPPAPTPGVIVFAVVLVLLLIFILQNTQSVQISYLGATGHVSLAVAMLLTAIAGSLRIWQLRRHLRRSAR